MLLTTVKRKSIIINKLLFMTWGALSVMAAQQLWPNHSPVITPTAANGTSQQAIAQESVQPQTLSAADASAEQPPTESHTPSTTPYTSVPPQVSVVHPPVSPSASPTTSPASSNTEEQVPTQNTSSKRAKINVTNSLRKTTSDKSESSSRSNASLACIQAVLCL